MNVSKKVRWAIIALIEIPLFVGIFVLGKPYNLYALIALVVIPYMYLLLNI